MNDLKKTYHRSYLLRLWRTEGLGDVGMMSRCVKMMPQMMAMCGGAQDDKEETTTDATRKAQGEIKYQPMAFLPTSKV